MWKTYGIEIEILWLIRVQLAWVMMCRGYTRYVDGVSVPMSCYNIPSMELISEKAVDTADFFSKDRDNSAMKKRTLQAARIPRQRAALKAQFASKKGSGILFQKNHGKPEHLTTVIWKFVTTLLRHCNPEDRDRDGAVNWGSIL